MRLRALTDLVRRDDALAGFTRERLWALFDGDRTRLNVTHECVDRHRDRGIAVRVTHPGGVEEAVGFAELSDWCARIAAWLERAGVRRGERVAIMLEPSLAFYATLFGVMKSGAVAVPLFTLFGPRGLRLRIEDCRPRMLVAAPERIDDAREAGVPIVLTGDELLERAAIESADFEATTTADELALLQYTSGTTRELPEAVAHRHRTVVTVAVAALYATGVRPGDRFMCPSSPAWGHGLAHGTLGPLGIGTSIAAYAGRFEPDRLVDALEAFRINNLSAAATHYRMLRQSGALADRSLPLEKLTFTGEPLDTETAAWALRTFGEPARSIYGTTEVGVLLGQYPGAPDFEVRPGSLGLPMPGIDVAVIGPDGERCPAGRIGEIMVRRRSGWVSTHDLGRVDAHGHFYHCGRADDVIISAGWTIAPREVEDALLEHPAVRDAGVTGIPDSLRGHVVAAFVMPTSTPGEPAALRQTLQDHVRTRLGAHEYPRVVEFVDALTRTPAGKLDRRALKARAIALEPRRESR